jgi:hypothetical protein
MVGSGTVGVVLAHEYGNDLCGAWPFANYLAKRGFRAFAIDMRCFGRSACPQGDAAGRVVDDLAAAVAEAMDDVVTDTRIAVLDRYEKAAGRPDGLAVQGIGPVLAALRAEAVDTLLLDAGVARDATVWISEAPAQVAEVAEDLRATGADPTGQVPVDAALLRAAAGTGADFVPVGGGRTGPVGRPLDDGVGALLRYPLPAGA